MKRRSLLATAALFLVLATNGAAEAKTQVSWWHAMTGANNEVVEKLAKEFNASQRTTRSFRSSRAPIRRR